MDNPILRYYEAEMRYLREAGKEFAKAHPDKAALLNLDRVADRDPYVERLFEGFAFMMGRLRQKLDDDLPELTEGLVSLLWPHYLRTIPSLAIIEFAPQVHQIKHNEDLPAGFTISTQAIGAKNTRCHYRTTRSLPLLPLQLISAHIEHEISGHSVLRLDFSLSQLIEWSKTDFSQLSFYINADETIASALHLALTLQCQEIRLHTAQGEQSLTQAYFAPGGFEENNYLWPNPSSSFSGYQLLLEYFTFPAKFKFVTLKGLPSSVLTEQLVDRFSLTISLKEPWPFADTVNAETLCLHCVPVVNLFELDADPMTISTLENEYLIRALRIQDGHTEIYSVDEVSSFSQGEQQHYVPFSSFRHRGGMMRHEAPERFYHTRVRQGAHGLHDTWLILGGERFNPDEGEQQETLSLRVTGTNGQLPRKALQSCRFQENVIFNHIPLNVKHLTPPTLPCYPPANDRFHWRVMSHLGSNFLSMMDNAEILRGTLALYDWTHNEMNRRRLNAIIDVKHQLIQRVNKGFLLRGVAITLTLDEQGFAGEGDISLFGEMLNRFFALYADVHLFNQLSLTLTPSGKQLQWTENHSQRIPS